jgi:hypothetical protein
MKKGSDLLVAALENEGVERIFGIPAWTKEQLGAVYVMTPLALQVSRNPLVERVTF